jgi:hypothetical protein
VQAGKAEAVVLGFRRHCEDGEAKPKQDEAIQISRSAEAMDCFVARCAPRNDGSDAGATSIIPPEPSVADVAPRCIRATLVQTP